MRRLAATLALVVAAVAAATAVAEAGGPGRWTRATDATLRNIMQVGLTRTADGVLHVVWVRPAGTKSSLVHTPVSPAGNVGATTAIVSGWGTLTSMAQPVVTSSGLRAFFSGIRSTNVSDPYSGGWMYSATGNSAGTSWTLDPGSASPASSAYASDSIGATLRADGTPVTSWSGSPGTFFHVGADTTVPNTRLQAACCGYQTALATDAKSGAVVMAWFSNAKGSAGIHVKRVLPTPGPDRILPGSAAGGNAVSPGQAVALASRAGGGIYVAYGAGYPTWKAVNVWVETSGRTTRVWSGTVRHFSTAPGPDGRIWVTWVADDKVWGTRSNKAATAFGPVSSVSPPAGADTLWKVQGDGARGPLDVLLPATVGGKIAFWHTQIPPVLSLRATVQGATGKATFTVLDAGDRVAGATVTVGGRKLQTDKTGSASATFATGSYDASASAPGYVAASASVRVPERPS